MIINTVAEENTYIFFPEDFPQKDPNAWIYPIEALGESRRWMDNVYVSEKFGAYLYNKAKKGGLGNVDIPALVKSVQPISLEK